MGVNPLPHMSMGIGWIPPHQRLPSIGYFHEINSSAELKVRIKHCFAPQKSKMFSDAPTLAYKVHVYFAQSASS